MPLIVATLIRVLIQAAVQTGIFIALEKILGPIIDAAKSAVAGAFNMTEEEAQDSIANEIIDAFAMIGIIGVGIKTKLPTKAAEKLGFTSKGYAKRQISGKLPTGVAGSAAKAVTSATAKIVPQAEASGILAAAKGMTLVKATAIIAAIGGGLSLPIWGLAAIMNALDPATWSNSAFLRATQNIWGKVGFLPDTAIAGTKILTTGQFQKTYNEFTLNGAVAINDPFKLQSVPFTEQNFGELIDKMAAQSSRETGKTDIKLIKQLMVAVTVFQESGATAVAPSVMPTPTAPVTSAPARVFTGIVSQGVLGAGLNFTPRPDDLIESAEELTTAAHNNLAPFLAALPAKLYYEIKIVSSVKAAGEFIQKSTSQRIITGYNRNGTPKYKTVFNKFAVMDIIVLTANRKFVKISSIVLGPVDAIKFQGGNVDLQGIATNVKQNITAPAIDLPQPATPTATQPNAPTDVPTAPAVTSAPTAPTAPIQAPVVSTGLLGSTGQRTALVDGVAYFTNNAGDLYNQAGQRVVSTASGVVLAPITAPVVSQPVATSPKAGVNAATLYEWYTAQGQNLPSVQTRSVLYANLGLGQATYYTGTAEQNVKLLAALKAK